MENYPELDIHKSAIKYQMAQNRLLNDVTVLEANKKHILNFLNDCQLGKTILKRQKKKIKTNRLLKYIYILKGVSQQFGKDFKAVSQTDMEQYIVRLENDTLTVVQKDGTSKRLVYSEWTKHDIKVAIRKFYKWMMGDNREYPRIVSWIDTSMKEKDPPALTLDEIRMLADFATTAEAKAKIWVLFETGGRISEFLNIRIGNVTDKEKNMLIRIQHSKTFKRTLPVYEGQHYLRQWLAVHPTKDDPSSQLFPVSYAALKKWLGRLGAKAINKHVYPHLLRHSLATWLAGKKVGRYQMCKVMGWAMSSNMPDRYIDREGVIEAETFQSIRGDELTTVQSVNNELKKELSEMQEKYSQIVDRLDRHKTTDSFLDRLVSDKDVQDLLSRKISEMGLGDKLTSI